MKQHDFIVTMKAADLVELLEPAYAAWVSESKRDDELCCEPQDVLAEAGYPSLNQLLDCPSLLKLVIGGYLLEDFLGKLTWDGSGPIEYWLDTVTDCNMDGVFVHLSGVCYSKVGV